MRVSDLSSFQFQQSSMQDNEAKLLSLTKQINSGSTVNQPSDNPIAYQQKQSLQNQLDQMSDQQRTLGTQTNMLRQYDSIIGSFESNIREVRNLVQRASTASTDSTAMPGIANQIDTIIQGALSQANQNNAGQYLLGGTISDTPPFVVTGSPESPTSVIYVGDNSFPGIPLGDGQTLSIQLDGASILKPNGEDFFGTLINIRDQIKQGTLDASSALDQLATLENNVLDKQSSTGSASQYLSSLTVTLQERQTKTLSTLQLTAGADLPSTISEYSQAQLTQQTLFAVISQQSKLSLVNYLK